MNRPWMPLYVGDYLADTSHLNAAQHGAYLLLIMRYWQAGSLPDDDAQLAMIARMTPAEWKKARPIIRSFFADGWKHARVDRELVEAEEAYQRRASAGRAGGLKRGNGKQCLSNATSNAQAENQAGLKQSLSQPQTPPGNTPQERFDPVTGEVVPFEARRAGGDR